MHYTGHTCSAVLPAFFLLQLYPKERAAQFSDLRGSPCAGCSVELRGKGVCTGRGGHGGLPRRAPLPAVPGHRHTAKVPCCTFWDGDSLAHHSNGFTGLPAAQPANQGQEQTGKEPSIAPASTCTSGHEEPGRQPEPS